MKNCKVDRDFELLGIHSKCIYDDFTEFGTNSTQVWVDTYLLGRHFISNPVKEVYHGLTKEPTLINLN